MALVQPLDDARSGSRLRKRSSTISSPGFQACVHVDHWCGDKDIVFVEFRLRASLGRDKLEWSNVNRLRLCDGKGIERVTYSDPLVVLPTLLQYRQ